MPHWVLRFFPLDAMSSALVLVLVAALVLTIGVVTCVVSGRGMGGRPGGPAEPATAPIRLMPSAMVCRSDNMPQTCDNMHQACDKDTWWSAYWKETAPCPQCSEGAIECGHHQLMRVVRRWVKRITRRKPCLGCQRRMNKMLALHQGMDRLNHELSAQRDRQVRLQSVETDIALDLPPSIQLPDGEELPYGSATRLHIRDPEQESEIYQKCVRPPPNRTVFDGESPPPYRSSSAGLLASDWSSGSSSGSGGLLRCHSMSASQPAKRPPDNILGRTVRCLSGRRHEEPPRPPAVVVPTPRCRRLSAFSDSASTLASLPTVHCTTAPSDSKPQRPAV